MIYSDIKPAYTKGTFFASLEDSLLCNWIRGFAPDTPKNTKTEKLKFSYFGVTKREIQWQTKNL